MWDAIYFIVFSLWMFTVTIQRNETFALSRCISPEILKKKYLVKLRIRIEMIADSNLA